MKPLERIFEAARHRQAHIILSEGHDPRVREAAARITAEGLARITLIDGEAPGAASIDSAAAADLPALAAAWRDLRAGKKDAPVTDNAALEDMRDPIRQAAMRVRLGQADGTVGGAVATTADTVRAALQAIGRAPGVHTVSSFFLMLSCAAGARVRGGMIFSDCGLVVAPDATELADIAIAAAGSCLQLLGEEPRVAMLSFSTAGSAEHPSLGRIREAHAIVRDRMPELEIDGEIQFDAALDDTIRARKAPSCRLTAPPNVFVFPDLASGNIGYKIAERLGGVTAIGPILQGLAKPANDLSRGCSVDDIIAVTAVTAVQAAASPRGPQADDDRMASPFA